VNEVADCFISTATGEQMSLDDAVNAGLVKAQFDDISGKPASEPTYEIKTYAIGFVVDQVRTIKMFAGHWRTWPFSFLHLFFSCIFTF